MSGLLILFQKRNFLRWRIVSLLLLLGAILWSLVVFASPVTIDVVSSNINTNNITGAQTVFVSDSVGYTFYRDNSPNIGRCVYSKTTDGGQTWGTPVRVDGQTDCVKIVVWYDQWTPGGTGNFIHIVTMDTGDNDLWYNRLDTATDTRLLGETPVNITSSAGYAGGLTEAANTHSMTVGTDGIIYAAVSDNSDSIIVSCSATCTTAANWTEVGSPGTLGNATDHNLLLPLAGGSILLINRTIVTGVLQSRVWNGATWGSWGTIDAFVDNQPLFIGGISATVDPDTGEIYLAYTADHNDYTTADHDIRTARYSSSTWIAGADVLTNVSGRGVHNVSVALDTDSGAVYVIYTIRDTIGTNTSAHVYWKRSVNALVSWESEQGPVTAVSGNYHGPFANFQSNERIYAAWFNPSGSTRFGATIADVGPDVVVSATGTPVAEIRSGFTGHLGGTFVVSAKNSHTLSSVTVSELGTIDESGAVSDVALYYDLDVTAPYDCASESFSGTELQFGATSTGGFVSATGSVTFTGAPLGVSATQTICAYVVLTIAATAPDQSTIAISIVNPTEAVVVSSVLATPDTPITLATTTVVSAALTQTGYHWRNDDGTESDATSATAGVENTALTDLAKNTLKRLRLQVSAEGSTTSPPTALRLEYGLAAPTCAAIVSWVPVSTSSADWILADSSLVTDGTDTTNFSAASAGAISDANSTFLTPNAGVRDQTNPVDSLVFASTSFVEVEFAIQAEPAANDGETYCFRLTDAGSALFAYTQYPEVTIAADVSVTGVSSYLSSVTVPTTTAWFGGSFAVIEQGSSRQVQSVTVTETGTIDASTSLEAVELFYDFDTTAPYDCASESYDGSELQFGTTSLGGFSGPDGSLTFTDAITISTTSALCLYVIADVTASAQNGQTVSFQITNPSTEVIVSGGGSVAPSTAVAPTGATTLVAGVLAQTGYHWRNDDGGEAGATSATGGFENTVLSEFSVTSGIRLRIGVANEGLATSAPQTFQLEYGTRVTTCDLVSSWTPISAGVGEVWNISTSTFLIHGNDTTNISVASGGISDGGSLFRASNSGVRTETATTSQLNFAPDEFTEYEFNLRSSLNTAFDTTYCFRLTNAGAPLTVYTEYPALTTAPKRDYRVQRGSVIIATSSATIVAGIDYEAPQNANTAFIRITNAHHTGAGNDTSGGTQNANTVTAYIQNPDDLTSSITFNRAAASGDTTHIDWEIVEFIGVAGTDNEMIVRSVGTVSLSGSEAIATGSIASVTDTADVVVFITGVKNTVTTRNYFAGQVTSAWSATASAPVFTREIAANAPIEVSYAVVEYSGVNWRVQRVAHTYTAAGVTETATINPVGSLSRAFLHTQKQMGQTDTVASLGHTVWLSSIGNLSLVLDADADMSQTHRAVVWVIENTQIGTGAMDVQRLSGTTLGGSQPLSLSLSLPSPLLAVNNASVFLVTRAAIANTAHPRAFAGVSIASTTAIRLWRSNTGSTLTYRAEVVTWPIADLAVRQVAYRFYVDNNQITPTDPWPAGVVDLGENTSITRFDDPLGVGEVVRVRIGLRASNANMPADFSGYALEFAPRITTCSAVSTWEAVGQAASSTIWRGYAATGTSDGVSLSGNPPTTGDLLLSSAAVAGSLVHQNPSPGNPYAVAEGLVVEYDWYLEQNGAPANTTYCFRMVRDDNVPLREYLVYPQLRTASFLPFTQGWRWYTDPENETPLLPAAAENVTPVNVSVGETLALRIAVAETKSIAGINARYRLQFSEDSLFTNPIDVVATTTCTGGSLWCFFQGAGLDNATITTALLSGSDVCSAGVGAGCGTHHVSNNNLPGHMHEAGAVQEYSFTIIHDGARVNTVYYFRLYDEINDEPVPPAVGETYPAIATESAALTLTISGLPVGTTTAGVVVSATATASAVNFGSVIPDGSEVIAGQRVFIATNATQGYQVLKYARQPLLNQQGVPLPSIAASNSAPVAWLSGCVATSTACIGYHSTDATLANGSTRFGANDTYVGIHETLEEIMYSSVPATEAHDVVYRLRATPLQLPGTYETSIVYIAVPVH